jgi:prephenate dehydrogenase
MEDGLSLEDSTIAIFGLGLMGGSLALGLKGHCGSLVGFDPDPGALELARHQKIVDVADRDPGKQILGADLVVLAAPVPAILALLDQLPSYMPDRCIVIDLGSTKKWIVEAMSRLPERFDPIGAHPLCGSEKLSLANARGDLYRGAAFVLTPLGRTTPRALSAARQIIEAVGAKAVILGETEHDRVLASTSHLPFLLSSALTLATPSDVSAFIGPGYRSTARLAGTPSSMMLGVLESNRENILDAVHGLQEALAEIESVLAENDISKLERLLNEAQDKYRALVQG